MNKLSKILVSVLSSFAFLCAPLFLVGCGGSMTTGEVNEMLGKAANTYFDSHTEIATYADTTYHWTENSTVTGKVTLNYKATADADEYVEGKFDNSTTTVRDLTIAVKKSGENLISKLVLTSTVTEDGYEVDATDGTAKHVVTTTRETRTYRLYTYTAENIVNYVLIGDISTKEDDNDAEVSKEKAILTDTQYENIVNNYLVGKTNSSMRDYFFGISGEMLVYYENLVNTQKDGDQVTIGTKFENIVDVSSSSFIVSKTSSEFNTIFAGDKISKANSSTERSSKEGSYKTEYTFDIAYSAAVDTVADTSEYNTLLVYPVEYFEGILSSLPEISFFG